MDNVCQNLHVFLNKLPNISYPFEISNIPRNGIYVLFETGESSHGTNRIVRIGTHRGTGNLPSRLKEHYLKENKDRSIFRKHIGRALLRMNNDPFIDDWEVDLTSPDAKDAYKDIDHTKQRQVEQAVTRYIQENIRFVVFQVDEKEKRLFLESRLISTVSLCQDCKPSSNWLGNYSPKEKIRQSGLWNVNELYKEPFSESEFRVDFLGIFQH